MQNTGKYVNVISAQKTLQKQKCQDFKKVKCKLYIPIEFVLKPVISEAAYYHKSQMIMYLVLNLKRSCFKFQKMSWRLIINYKDLLGKEP